MFSIEHDFEETVITLIDEPAATRRGDVTIRASDTRVVVEQDHPEQDAVSRITLSIAQLQDLAAALDLPEGVYRIREG